jgi:hypothetical protein
MPCLLCLLYLVGLESRLILIKKQSGFSHTVHLLHFRPLIKAFITEYLRFKMVLQKKRYWNEVTVVNERERTRRDASHMPHFELEMALCLGVV